ncbi:hypothetical protein FB451DRAFT_1487886 [Mycena latifolia]|nr:hypothetical protein FB451DRAFT_1487886 [Mycena latifolia]
MTDSQATLSSSIQLRSASQRCCRFPSEIQSPVPSTALCGLSLGKRSRDIRPAVLTHPAPSSYAVCKTSPRVPRHCRSPEVRPRNNPGGGIAVVVLYAHGATLAWAIPQFGSHLDCARRAPHLFGSGLTPDSDSLPFPSSASAAWDSSEECMSIDAFWTVVLLNILGGSRRSSSAISSPQALASILLERVIAFGALKTGGPSDSRALARIETRLDRFRASLPLGPSSRVLILAHALTDTAIIRLHAAYASIAASSRSKCLAAAARITSSLGNSRSFQHPDPVLGAVYLATYSFYIQEMGILCDRSLAGDLNATLEYCALDVKVKELIRKLGEVASCSPMIEQCTIQMQRDIRPSAALGLKVARKYLTWTLDLQIYTTDLLDNLTDLEYITTFLGHWTFRSTRGLYLII